MNGTISAHLLSSKIICVRVKALWQQWKFQIDILRVWVLHDGEMSKNITTHSFWGKIAFIVTVTVLQ